MFGDAPGMWATIATDAQTFFTPVSPMVRFALGLALALTVVALGRAVLRRRSSSSSSSRSGSLRVPAAYIQAPSSGSIAYGARASMPRLNLREKNPDWREWHSHLGSTETFDGKTGEKLS